MTREETVKILSILKAAYPNSYKGMTREEGNGVISVWASQFAHIPAEIVVIAINKLISTSTFPPAIAEVKEKIKSLYWEAQAELLSPTKHFSEAEKQKLRRIAMFSNIDEEPSLEHLVIGSGEGTNQKQIGEKHNG